MNKLRCLCFKAINRLYGKTEDIRNYIKELEQQVRDSAEALTLCFIDKRKLEQQNKELLKIIEDDYQYFALKNNTETGRAKLLKTIIEKYKND